MIETQSHGDVLEIRLARPPVNALNPDLLRALRAAVLEAPKQGARGIVLSGGVKVFSAGLDVPHLMQLQRESLIAAWSDFFAATRALAESPVPVAAAITGHSPAGGCVLALACDYRVLADFASIGLNETQVGLTVPEAIQTMMRRVVGAHRAERWLVAGAMIDSDNAARYGLVDEVAEATQVTARALVWVQDLLRLPNAPMLATRRIARADLVQALDGFEREGLPRFIEGWYSADTQRALHALLERLKK